MSGQYPTSRRQDGRCGRRELRRGVTLLEIMVVVAILSILIGALAYVGSRSTDDAKIKQTQALFTSMDTVLHEYELATGRLPTTCYWTDSQGGGIRPPRVIDPDTGKRDDFFRDQDGYPAGQGEGYCPSDDTGMCTSGLVYSIQGLYHQLMRETKSKQALTQIDSRYIVPVASDEFQKKYAGDLPNAAPRTVYSTSNKPGTIVPSAIFVDGWQQPLFFAWMPNSNNALPYLQSAGPDGLWNTEDDLYSYD